MISLCIIDYIVMLNSRVTKIKPFIKIRKYKTSPKHILKDKIYSNFVIDRFKHGNPL